MIKVLQFYPHELEGPWTEGYAYHHVSHAARTSDPSEPARNKDVHVLKKLAGVIVLGLLVAAPLGIGRAAMTCPIELPQGSTQVTLDPADFVAGVDNPYWPMAPGTKWVYREADTRGHAQDVVVKVKARTKDILGITATVVRDVVSEDGELVEDTRDWYAQDVCGNVWYMGESTKEYENGQVVTTAGSWEAGVDGALAGVVVPADPQVGMAYRHRGSCLLEGFRLRASERPSTVSASST